MSLLTGSALAAAPANCAKPVSFFLGSLYYTSQAAFPEPEQRVELDFLSDYEPVAAASACGVTFKADARAGTITATAKQLAMLARVYSSRGVADGEITLSNLLTARGDKAAASDVIFNLKTRELKFQPAQGLMATYTLGVKIDGGAVQPLYYNGKATPLRVPSSAGVIDIYAKPGPGVLSSWRRVTIDLKAPLIRTYDEAAFPAR